MRVINSEKIPIKLWLPYLEDGAEVQAKNLANLPFAFKHVAIMPDSHQGYGMPIGGVLATKDVIIPNAVGVDIGCGMCAVKTDITEIGPKTLKRILSKIRKVVPVGFKKHKEDNSENGRLMPIPYLPREEVYAKYEIVNKEWNNACLSIGTLGGGNHFIEIQEDMEGYIWIMLHSGSRNLGKQVAEHYNNLAIKLNEKWHSPVPKSWELAYLPVDSEEGQAYIREMNYCVDFALANRKLMMNRIMDIFETETHCCFPSLENGSEDFKNIAHNYAVLENHFGENVWVHRKGATLAREGTIGIIPGSQGSKSYIVKGKGNPDSFMSCSHGAGRTMSRAKARKDLNLEEEIKKLDDQGIIHGIRHQQDLDEASSAYKNIDEVMANQKDLVDILVELRPLAVIKG